LCVAIGCQEAQPPATEAKEIHRTGPLTAEQFDECASRFADALRRWPVVDRAEAPILLANPRWKNQADYWPVKDGPAFVGSLMDAVNLRTGAKVRIAPAGTVGCHYATEIVAVDATDARNQPVVALAFRVVRPGVPAPLLEEVFTVQRRPTTAPTGPLFGFRLASQPAQPRAAMRPTYQVVQFQRGQVHLNTQTSARQVEVLAERTWRDRDGQLCIAVRLLSRTADTSVDAVVHSIDPAGRQSPQGHSIRQSLPARQPVSLVVTLPKTAQGYALYLAGR